MSSALILTSLAKPPKLDSLEFILCHTLIGTITNARSIYHADI